MSYTPHTPEEIRAMLARIGVGSIEELLDSVPGSLREAAALKLPPAQAERTVLRHLRGLAARNHTATEGAHFLGAGAYAHDIPAAVDALAARSEFATAYTPYQAEVAQGTLQAIFEFQTLVCQLTGLDVANASMYDGASATAEAALMALRTTRRRRLCVSAGLHPHYRQVLDTCTRGVGASIDTLPLDAHGRTPSEAVPEDAAALLIQSPNFFGCVEDLAPHAAAAGDSGALLIAATTEALALALLRPPGEFGADVACGEAQSFGVPLSFGGPFVGYLASRNKHLRQLPGRLIGETVDVDGKRAFAMTLTTREQHIRREHATSNICTNQGLMALRATIYLALLGRRGLRELARTNLSLARYARRRFESAGFELVYDAPIFNEFVVRVPGLAEKHAALLERGVQPGLSLEPIDPQRRDQLLICTTELVLRPEIDRLVRELAA